ncbi:MAG: tRNA (N(6)-L-threonylcarbamoyladenosine(37)-C(2))-methylthiotransferase MtaB [Caldithrix sp.]|nr:tRNA (N(6)-L-threonylcarbamoyladenosine(37)-C(2))-methylthiotransferase MtaB [Caldithrix sp.]
MKHKAMPKASLHTLGCRLNQAETAIIANKLQQHGFEIVDFGQKADLTVINTCTVTEQADAKCRQAVRKSIRTNPDTFVTVIGCYAQMDVQRIQQIKGVDLIIGNEHKMQLHEHLNGLTKYDRPQVIHTSKISRDTFTIDTVGLFDAHTRANLKVQDGCNFVCSFCIIATARGPARSRSFDDIIREAYALRDMGFKEIVLTGVNIGTYQEKNYGFMDILKALEKIDGIHRIRISSIEPTTVSYEILDYIAESRKICKHLHIPVQSGDDRILESMRRKHDSHFFSDIIQYAYKNIPDVGIGTDVMVGYPGEDDAAFSNTKKLLADLPIAYYHVFTYSDRKRTRSYKMRPKVDHNVKKHRNRIMIEQGNRQKHTFYQKSIGSQMDVLFEQNAEGYWHGLSDNYIRVAAEGDNTLKNEIKKVHITRMYGERLVGDLL